MPRPESANRFALASSMFTVYTGLCGGWIAFFSIYAYDYLKLSPMLVGLVFSASSACFAIGNLLGAVLSRIFGRVNALVILYGISIASLTLIPWLNPILACLGFVTYFLGIGGVSPIVHATTLDVLEGFRARATLYAFATRFAPSIAAAAFIPFAGYLTQIGLYSICVFIAMAALLGVAFMAIALARSSESKCVEVSTWRAVKGLLDVLNNRIFLVIATAFSVEAMCIELTEWYIPIYFRKLGFSAGIYGVSLGASTIVIAFTSLASGALVDALGVAITTSLAWFLGSSLHLAMALYPSLVPELYPVSKVSSSLTSVAPAIAIAKVYKTRREEALACYRLLTQLASIPAPTIGGVLASLDIRAPLIFRCLAMTVSAIAMLTTFKVASQRR